MMNDIIEKFPSLNICVCGDMMIDRYVYGDATRISPEAPVPVVLFRGERDVLGGAANVANNIIGLSANAMPIGVCGNDDDGHKMLKIMSESLMDTSYMIESDRRMTTVKTRIIAGNQQIVRLDSEVTCRLGEDERRTARESILDAIKNRSVDAVIFEDYAKGFLDDEFMSYAVGLANGNGIMTALDPHPSSAFRINGIGLMTPNRKEAFQLAGMSDVPCEPFDGELLEAGRIIIDSMNPKLLLITLGADGMMLFRKDEKPFYIPTVAKHVFDVSGAGDTVMATMVLALMSGASAEDSAVLANCAAGIVVSKQGTSPIKLDELNKALSEE